MVFIEQPKKEGDTMDCPTCNVQLIGRLKEYNDFPSKIQWQDTDKTKAHFDKDGNCNSEGVEPTTQESTPQFTVNKSDVLLNTSKKIVQDESEVLLSIRNEVLDVAGKYDEEPNLGMVWEMTHAIWLKHYSDRVIEIPSPFDDDEKYCTCEKFIPNAKSPLLIIFHPSLISNKSDMSYHQITHLE